jgi:hypothetical protein
MSMRSEGEEGADTWIFPSVQMGPLGVQQDSQLTERILRSGQSGRRTADMLLNLCSTYNSNFMIFFS